MLFVIFRIKSVTQTQDCNHTSLWFPSQLKQHSGSSIQCRLNHHWHTFWIIFRVKENIVHTLKGLSNLFVDMLPHKGGITKSRNSDLPAGCTRAVRAFIYFSSYPCVNPARITLAKAVANIP